LCDIDKRLVPRIVIRIVKSNIGRRRRAALSRATRRATRGWRAGGRLSPSQQTRPRGQQCENSGPLKLPPPPGNLLQIVFVQSVSEHSLFGASYKESSWRQKEKSERSRRSDGRTSLMLQRDFSHRKDLRGRRPNSSPQTPGSTKPCSSVTSRTNANFTAR